MTIAITRQFSAALVIASALLVACAGEDARETTATQSARLVQTIDPLLDVSFDSPMVDAPTSVHAGGSVSCDFQLPATMNTNDVGPIIERDRMYMAARPGFIRKAIPLSPIANNGGFNTGGRYLFAHRSDANNYFNWLVSNYVLDGTHFFDRSYFLNPQCHVWSVVGATDFGAYPDSFMFVRTERYSSPDSNRWSDLHSAYPAMRSDAQARGYSGLWLNYSPTDRLVEITYFTARYLINNAYTGAVTVDWLSAQSPLGAGLQSTGYTPTYDKAQFVLTDWQPFQAGDQGLLSPWPNSPPLPGPSCGDGVCSPSRGETNASCASDCRPHCGDATCQASEGEDTHVCPSDCRL